MDYLNRAKTRRHQVTLLVGYVLVAIAIAIGTLILVYQSYGFGLGKNGTVIQNGLIFFSSQPHPANIYIDGKLNSAKTNSRLVLPANIYQVKLSRSGYRTWQRTINLNGGSVEHFDYPLLFPVNLTTKKLQTYTAAPGLMTQSPDRRWLLIEQPGSMTDFDLYDLKNPTKPPTALSLPDGLLSKATTSESWQFGAWADDDQHLLLQHVYDGKSEFILLDRSNPAQSINLNTTLAANPTTITLNNQKYNQYYLYNSDGTLQTASLSSPTPTARLTHVLAYKSYGNDSIMYVTADGAPADKVLVKLVSGNQTTTLRSLPAGSSNYLVDLTQYSGVLYAAIGDSAENKVYIYRDPLGQLAAQPDQAIVPAQVLHVEDPNYLSFSTNAQFIVVENGQHFGVYDIENKLGYNYSSPAPLDAPQTHATWMDGDRLIYVSNNKLNVADYDNTNRQSLMPANGNYLPVFAPDYTSVYALASLGTSGQFELTQTSLLTPTDQ